MMYLLLRDNKQSGPYSLDELKTKGLKAYDLVWVEGRSAAWRYPSEIAEMSSFAPAVEEQPFDRFYKKPAAALSTVSSEPGASSQPAASNAGGASVPNSSPYSDEFSSTSRKRTIYVTMPGGSAPVVLREKPAEPVRENYREPAREQVSSLPVAGSYQAANMPVAGSYMEYSTRPEAIRDRTGEIMPQIPQRQKVRMLQPVAVGVGILVLLTSGIFIGLSIQKDGTGLHRLASGTGSTDNAQPITHPAERPLPVSAAGDKVVIPPQTQPTTSLTTEPSHSENAEPAPDLSANKPPRTIKTKQKVEGPKNQAVLPLTITDSSSVQPAMVHREAVHRTDPAENQPVANIETVKAGLLNQVSVGTNKYDVGTFGGINHLQVTVTNRSAWSLDLVVVEVQYIQANKKTYRTENLYFHGISPGSALMLEAPKSPRGIRVQYKITSINSKELGLSESGT
jgi:hypothetical protein